MRARVSSMRTSYFTPDGHAVTHPMQPRHWSMWRTTSASSTRAPEARPRMRSMRPRGESASSLHDWYVGQAGRQKPQWTQSSRRLRAGAADSVVLEPLAPDTSEPSHEPSGIQEAVGVEAVLETPHDVE